MPSPQEALDHAKRFIGSMPVDDAAMKYRILDDAHRALWMRAPWRWSIASVEPVVLQNGVQDYALTPISDFFTLVQSAITNGQEKHDLRVVSVIPSTGVITGRPSQVQGSAAQLRFWPVPTGYTTGPTVFSIYKKTTTAISSGNVNNAYSTLGIPNEWFWVYQEMVMLKAMQFSNNPKAGGVTVANNVVQYTGQYGAVEAAIQEMIRGEKKFLDSLGLEVTSNG